jgi:hypothetical protein
MPASAYATLHFKGKRYVLVPEKEYERFAQAARPLRTNKTKRVRQNAGDIAEAKRRLAAGGFRPYAKLRKELGLT